MSKITDEKAMVKNTETMLRRQTLSAKVTETAFERSEREAQNKAMQKLKQLEKSNKKLQKAEAKLKKLNAELEFIERSTSLILKLPKNPLHKLHLTKT